MKLAKTIMVQGTASNVGKSIVTTALCRMFTRRGFKVAPFKAQNMANNSFVTKEGGEIGRAQAVQAYACNATPTQIMNPILLKPNSDQTAQVIVMGKPESTLSARDYQGRKKYLSGYVFDSLQKLRASHDIVVIEGAGSCAEINLKQNDIVNMNVAKEINAPVILVADIDKGGVFAQIIGTFELLDSDEKKLIKTFLINKFRGDKDILMPGINWIEKRLNRKSLGVLPMIKNINIEEEDAVVLDENLLSKNRLSHYFSSNAKRDDDQLLIQIIRLPRISNFTDFECLSRETGVTVQFIDKPSRHIHPDLLIIPGTKNTIGDLQFLKRTGFVDFIHRCIGAGVNVMGICGGFQMMGQWIEDPLKLESNETKIEGLGIIPTKTIFEKKKTTVQIKAVHIESGSTVEGYEIHMGQTHFLNGAKPLFKVVEKQGMKAATFDGAFEVRQSNDHISSNIYGTYIHGLFDSSSYRKYFLNKIRKNSGLNPKEQSLNIKQISPFDHLANEFENHMDLTVLEEMLGIPLC